MLPSLSRIAIKINPVPLRDGNISRGTTHLGRLMATHFETNGIILVRRSDQDLRLAPLLTLGLRSRLLGRV